MKVPLSWLKDYVDIPVSLEEISERLTLAGLEVEAIERIGDWWDRTRIVVGEVVEVRPHPDADRLVLVDVRHREGTVDQCVTGLPTYSRTRAGARSASRWHMPWKERTCTTGTRRGLSKRG